jgi:D-alanyl-D-alanine carboxypeptidase/D-alanyl-D-alanine-endopeptidase (penicillin-binding protein 4)
MQATVPVNTMIPITSLHRRCLPPLALSALLLAAVAAHAQPAAPPDALPAPVAAELQSAGLPAAALAALVLPVTPGAPRLAHQVDKPMAPASTMKLVTTLVALDQLGATYRWHTQLLSDGAVKGNRLRGTLYLRGGADPNLTPDKLRAMLRTLRAEGVQHITGDLVLDRSLFQPQRLDLGVPPFDESPYAYYNVIPDALLLNSNVVEFTLESDADKATVRTLPPLAGLKLVNQLTLDDSRCEDWEANWQPTNLQPQRNGQLKLVLDGSYPRNCKTNTSLNLLERNAYIQRFVQSAWKELGGSWKGQVRDGKAPAEARLLVERSSDTLADAIKLINKPSDNMMARTVFLTLGQQAEPNGSNTLKAADAAVRQWFAAHQITSDGLVLENGSGLSRLERISPRQMAGLLLAGAHDLWYPEFSSSLPLAGVDGTMRRRLRDTVAPGQARIKTGTLRDVVAIAGYVRDKDRKDWVVAAMVNDDQAKKGRAALDALITWVAAGQPPAAAPLAGTQAP